MMNMIDNKNEKKGEQGNAKEKEQAKGQSGEQIKSEEHIRPTWDEYFMEVARAIAKRATCDRGRSGCVISKEKQILSTGYVGSPKGLPHCDEVGHLMKKVIHDDDTITQHCMRTVHAEQNAICQAAKMGVPIEEPRSTAR
jgi:dCMP deaminase